MENLIKQLNNPFFLIALCMSLGLVVGSFLNVVIYRLPKILRNKWERQCAEFRGEKLKPFPVYNLAVPHSNCPNCNHAIKALENIPVFSYLWLGGKCSCCKTTISLRYPMIEITSGLLSAYAAFHFGYGLPLVGALLLIWTLLTLIVIEFDTKLIPSEITFPLLWMGLFFNSFGTFTTLSSALLGVIFGYLSLLSVCWAFKFLVGQEGEHFADLKLFAALGAWFGWLMLIIIFLEVISIFLIKYSIVYLTEKQPKAFVSLNLCLAVVFLLNLFLGNY